MTTCNVNGVNIQINGLEAGPRLDKLAATLARMPFVHLVFVPPITVGNRPPVNPHNPRSYGGGGSAHRNMPGGPYIRLNVRTFDAPWNQGPLHYTLLHECGHIIDWGFGCMERMLSERRQDYDVLLAHVHRGRTQGPSEHYADAYADYIAGKPMSAGRRSALLNSAAFESRYVFPETGTADIVSGLLAPGPADP